MKNEKMVLNDALDACNAACIIVDEMYYWVDGSTGTWHYVIEPEGAVVHLPKKTARNREEAVAMIPKSVRSLKWQPLWGVLHPFSFGSTEGMELK